MNENNTTQGNNPNGNPNGNKQNNQGKPKLSIYWLYIAVIAIFIGMQFMHFGTQKISIDRRTLEKEMLLTGDVEKIIVINKKKADIYIKKDRITQTKYSKYFKKGEEQLEGPQFFMNIGSTDAFETQLKEAQAEIPEEQRILPQFEEEKDYLGDMVGWLLPLVIIIAIWMLVFRKMSGGVGGMFNVGKSRAQIFDKEKISVKIDFKDVAGLEEAKVEVKEIVDFLKNPKKYTDLGGKIPKGALLVGPPGTGKTLLAKAVAGEANVPFFSLSGSDFVEMFVGVGASRVRDLFKQAKEKAPCIIFIDEIDAIGRARGKNPNFGSNDERENTLNQLLTEMDGFGTNAGIIILAATNRADILDKALLRAGRFDRQIHVELPDVVERKAIFQVHLRPLKIESGLDTDFLARQTPGFSGADIANVCNEAALIAARNDKKAVEKQDFLDAVDRIIGGLERKNKIITIQEKRTIAFHEAGHATVSWMLEYAHPLLKVTIIPRGRALGAAWYQPEERQITTVEQLFDEMCATLGGRASEELTFKTISTGALNDLERVTKQAYAMVSYYGMGQQLGNMSFYDSSGQSEYAFTKPYSDKTSESIDNEAFKLVAKAYDRAKEILVKHEGGLKQLAEILLEKEVIFAEDLEKIFGKRPFQKEDEPTGVKDVIAPELAFEELKKDEIVKFDDFN
ncbi:MAG: ATP-dependent zinc metalloprotease FtsH [Bacteroidales bacterium]|jgi:cell division protease FtsH|nr:ATP-dependent zinc metalloprotease FtsH [Bacteroidales bacterium]